MNRFLEPKTARFDQPPRSFGIGLVPEAKCLLRCVERRADILATPPRPETPHFVHNFDCPVGVDFAHKVNSSGSQRQAPRRYLSAQASTQQSYACATSHLRRCLARKRGWRVMVHIPPPEERGLRLNLVEIGKLVPRPKA